MPSATPAFAASVPSQAHVASDAETVASRNDSALDPQRFDLRTPVEAGVVNPVVCHGIQPRSSLRLTVLTRL